MYHPPCMYALPAPHTQLHTQLYLEEMQNCVDIRQFDMSKVLLEQALGRGPARGRSAVPQYLVLKVSSLVYSALHPGRIYLVNSDLFDLDVLHI